MSLVIAAAALILASRGVEPPGGEGLQSAASEGASSATAETAAVGAARTWVGLVDSQQWRACWLSASALVRAVPEEKFTAAVKTARDPLGRVLSRTVQSTTHATSLPGLPAGDYEVVQFSTNFVGRTGAVETLALTRESGPWKVLGYFIR